ncbi:septal ring lytic transglycosylase RlpA family protein [Oleispirillum naphthae]|uniref:septal ring lytic transglycosylase RlpA family protein n=1 Tax=Oleispirillum naphthae TaxID=2838853 RepID=UPI003082522A
MATARNIPASGVAALLITGAVALMLSGCAESTLVAHTAKTFGGAMEEEPSGGGYKVGNPYQIDGIWYTPKEDYRYVEEGVASWYGPDFHGKRTANGERYDMHALTAAHRTLPMPSLVRVTNLENRRSAILRINDRGPFARNRILDVSKRAADALGFIGQGTARVRVEILAEESIALKERLQRGDSDFASAPVQVASLAPAGGGSVQRSELLPPVSAAPVARAAPAVATQPMVAQPVAQTVTAAVAQSYVQVGAFGDPANAARLKDRLAALGQVEVVPVSTSSGAVLHRVRLGPFADARDAETALTRARDNGFPDARLVLP